MHEKPFRRQHAIDKPRRYRDPILIFQPVRADAGLASRIALTEELADRRLAGLDEAAELIRAARS